VLSKGILPELFVVSMELRPGKTRQSPALQRETGAFNPALTWIRASIHRGLNILSLLCVKCEGLRLEDRNQSGFGRRAADAAFGGFDLRAQSKRRVVIWNRACERLTGSQAACEVGLINFLMNRFFRHGRA
jgi:hypothetical protein